MVRLLVVGAIALALVLGVGFLTRDNPGSGASADAAPNITLEFFDGTAQQLSDLQGKPVVLNFWASWCPACISEMPAFADVHRRLGDQVEFIGVNMQEVDPQAALDLVEETTVEYRLVHDPTGSMFNEFGGIAMPTTVFIGADGTVRRVHAGAMFADELTATIENDLLE